MGMRTLTIKEEKRLEILQRVFRGELTMGKASLVLESVSGSAIGSRHGSSNKE